MPKTKEGEAVPKSDNLEIVAIGSLYKGPWEKKYWSSSRGKDRYPYPVGYQAVRAHNGSTYKAEIHEGTKGPLFVITCEGQSCSGQTPDIAWEKFQKMGCSHLKIWHGKRFSCKIDGVEFFGLKNPFVQRLLRELVANVNGTAERSLLSSSSSNGASRTENENGSSTIFTAPDLLPYMTRPQIRKKRSTRCEIMQSKLADRPGLKRPRSKDLSYGTKGSNLVKGNQVKDELGFSAAHFASNDENDKIIEASAVHSKSVGKDTKISPAKDGFPLKSLDFSGHHGENEAKSKLISSQNANLTGVANIAHEELCRPQDTVLEGFSFPVKTDDMHGDTSVPNDSTGINDVNLCAPDTLDFEDDMTSVASGARDTTNGMEEELTAADVVISDGFMTESHQEEEIGTSNSNTGSEKSDFDSVGQEMTKLMMTVLLPQAVPLLKRFSKKKKETFNSCKVNSRKDNIETNHLLALPSFVISPTEDASTEQGTRTHIQGLVVPNLEHLNSVILDSFEDGQEDHVASQAVLFSKHMEVDRTSFNKDAFCSNIQEQLSINPKQETSVYCDVTKSESVLGCVSPVMKALSEDIQVVSVNLDENSADTGKHSVEKKPKKAHNCAEVEDTDDIKSRGITTPLKLLGKDSKVETRAPGTNFSHQTQNKVYTRKKVSKQAHSTRNYTAPLSESIICRNSGDDYAPNKSAMTGASLVPKSCHSSDDKPCNRNIFGNTPMIDEEKTTTNCKPEISNIRPTLSDEVQKLTCVSKAKDASCLLDPSVSLERIFQENCHEEKLEHRTIVTIVENSCSASCQNQVTGFCDKNLSLSMGVQGSLDVNHYRDVEHTSLSLGILCQPCLSTRWLLKKKGKDSLLLLVTHL
ncbi:Histone-lysine N-methyltransferase ATX1, putative isoform 2 [Hibiscus syriacus]|uniref:Histone-lysine N-methyltransferase ATX1, putative isoform 2 n=1 Tax=Hibiscus syriacus TaxID=106335 RepID=A0A6A3C7U4_HIBSY|nr:Histone-lysine N-methyltransferase ATX1, putative isoform 2 [Hibiscus syriacus]